MADQRTSGNASNTTTAPPLNYSVVAQLLPLALVIVIVNSLVVALFWKRRQLRTPQNYLLLGLALSDLLTGLLNIPLFITFNLIRPIDEALMFLVPVCHNFSAVLAAFQILAITADKFMAIRNPLKHRLLGTEKARRVVAAIWLVSAAVSFFPFCFYNKRNDDLYKTVQLAHSSFCIVAVFLVPYAFMIYAQCAMFKTISRSGQLTLNREDKDKRRAHEKMKRDRKCLVVFASMAAIYAICWIPWFVLTLLFSLVPFGVVNGGDFGESVLAFAVIIRYLSSIINPLIYTFFKRDFLSAFRVLVLKKPAQPSDSKRTIYATSTRLKSVKARDAVYDARDELLGLTVENIM